MPAPSGVERHRACRVRYGPGMSVPVALDQLHAALDEFGTVAYLLSAGGDGRPRCVSVALSWSEGLLMASVGKRTGVNIGIQPLVSLLWPPVEPGGYSLIVDGSAGMTGESEGGGAIIAITPSNGVRHRNAEPSADASACGSDCAPLA
jgi:hypothetical protein